jgi:hypothetical protein
MPQLVKKRRSGWAVLAAGALIASLLAVGSAPAGAAEIKAGEDNTAEPNVKPTFSACVGEAVDDQGFTDLGTLDHAKTNINCLAYYGISAGRTTDTFDPNANVRRSEMALFLYAAAGKAGADLMGGDMMADYGDISELGENWQNAITALARNGILTGSGGNFRPNDDITRAEMAVALVNLVRHTAPGNFVQAGTDKGQLVVNGAAITSTALDHFADARATVPRAVDTAISYAYELGITSGVGGGMFGPSDAVPRRDMATFIMNALAHSNLRPAGLTVQSDNGDLTASLRDADFKPVANALVDAFYVADTRADRAFNSATGRCRSIVLSVDDGSPPRCEISVLDSATDADGNASLNGLTSTQIGKGVTVWVWTGEAGDKYADGTTDPVVVFDQGPVTSPSAATRITVSPSQAMTPLARFGTAVDFTAQLQDTNGDNTSVGADIAMGGAEYQLVTHVYTGATAASTVDPASGTVTVTPNTLGVVSVSPPETLKTDADGKITFSLSTNDPNPLPTSLTDTRTVVYVLTPMTNAPGAGTPPTSRQVGHVIFAEEAPKVTRVKVEPIGSYAELKAVAASPAASHGVTVTVLDQYGNPMRNRAVILSSTGTQNSDTSVPGARRTGSAGSVRVFYSHDGTTAWTETITATWDGDTDSDNNPDTDNDGVPDTQDGQTDDTSCKVNAADTANNDICGTASIYWALRTAQATQGTGSALSILAANLANGEVVVDSDGDSTPWLVRYDDNDIFNTTVPASVGSSGYIEAEAFEALLATIVDPANQALDGTSGNGKRLGTLAWDGYDHDDEDDRTLFTFTLTVQ